MYINIYNVYNILTIVFTFPRLDYTSTKVQVKDKEKDKEKENFIWTGKQINNRQKLATLNKQCGVNKEIIRKPVNQISNMT